MLRISSQAITAELDCTFELARPAEALGHRAECDRVFSRHLPGTIQNQTERHALLLFDGHGFRRDTFAAGVVGDRESHGIAVRLSVDVLGGDACADCAIAEVPGIVNDGASRWEGR